MCLRTLWLNLSFIIKNHQPNTYFSAIFPFVLLLFNFGYFQFYRMSSERSIFLFMYSTFSTLNFPEHFIFLFIPCQVRFGLLLLIQWKIPKFKQRLGLVGTFYVTSVQFSITYTHIIMVSLLSKKG